MFVVNMRGRDARCGRDVSAARALLGWPMKRAVAFYYTVREGALRECVLCVRVCGVFGAWG